MRIYTAGERDRPGIVVMVHGPGLDRFIEAQVDALAAHGFLAAAPDVFHRQPEDGSDVMTRVSRLLDREILEDIDTVIAHLRARTRGPLAITGFCMGGRTTYLAAGARPETWRAAAMFYGGNIMEPWGDGPSPFERTAQIACPILGVFGDDDTNPSPVDVATLDVELTKHGIRHDFHSYAGAGHAFLDVTNPERHRPAQAADAWAKLLAFFDRELVDRPVYGTSDPTSPVTRAELERALRGVNLGYLEMRDAMLELGARLIALTDELTRRIDGVEPLPAPEGTPAPAATATVELGAHANVPTALASMRAAAELQGGRVSLDIEPVDKYEMETLSPPCDELMPICKARCCRMSFSLSTQDLEEGVIRFDYGQPYLIRQRESDGYCVHNDPSSHGCTVHAQRPRVCRKFDCRDDDRIWADYDKRIPATSVDTMFDAAKIETREVQLADMMGRVRAREAAFKREKAALAGTHADLAPSVGPPAKPRRLV